jgi:DNA-binding NarL/FixJ family response regulator
LSTDAFNLPAGKRNSQFDTLKTNITQNIAIKFNNVFMTKKQSKIAELILNGFSNGEIAKNLGITEATVKGHLSRIFRETGVKSRSEYIVKKYREAIVVYGESL